MKLGKLNLRLGILKTFFSYKKRLKIYSKIDIFKILLSNSYFKVRDGITENFVNNFYNYSIKISEDQMKEKIKILKTDLDKNSQKEIDNFLIRQKYFYTHNLVNQSIFYKNEELEEQKISNKEIKKIEKKLKKFQVNFEVIESFYGQSGLRFLDKDIKEKIKNGVFVDIGAYDGDSAVSFYFNFSPSKIYAFEPEINNFNKLKKMRIY